MGNSGSTHYLNTEKSSSDLNFYRKTQSQQLTRNGGFSSLNPQRTTTDWRKSFPTPCVGSKGEIDAQIKVLRATTNGAILNSGGTISGRKQHENELLGIGRMQRSQTFIFDSIKDVSPPSYRRSANTTEFQRSQTLLHVKVKTGEEPYSKMSNMQPMRGRTYSEPDFIKKLNSEKKNEDGLHPSSIPIRERKYTKKRRAPEAPHTGTPTALSQLKGDAIKNPQPLAGEARPQLFTKNTDRASKIYLVKSEDKNVVLERNDAGRKSVSGAKNQEHITETPPKFVYRREKSADAIMLKSRKSQILPEHINMTDDKQNILSHRKSTENTLENQVDKSNSQIDKSKNTKAPIQPTKVPKLKRTFYFGMDADTTTDALQLQSDGQKTGVHSKKDAGWLNPTASNVQKNRNSISPAIEDPLIERKELSDISKLDLDYKSTNQQGENFVDNGLRVKIRPTLPRRQAETPSFSPMVAWKTLVEEQNRLERLPKSKEHSKLIPHVEDSLLGCRDNDETPIQPIRLQQIAQMPKSADLIKANVWTPKQDLGDSNYETIITDDSSSDEYRSKEEEERLLFYGSRFEKPNQPIKNASSPIHLFSLSLPRDVHIQYNKNILKSDNVCVYNSLQKTKPGYYFGKRPGQSPIDQGYLGSQSNHITMSKFDVSNNWMLHRSFNSLELHTKNQNDIDEGQKLHSIEPQSLKLLTGGKHIMYLPVSNESVQVPLNNLQDEEHIDMPVKVTHNRNFRSRQRHVPQNMQDETPIFPLKSYEENHKKMENEKSFFQKRFSFQEPMNFLERRLSLEKAIKKTEAEKVRRTTELEALKRVEEEFQRKRANEKENIRHQLRLHFGNEADPDRSKGNTSQTAFNLNDRNNNLFCCDDSESYVANPKSGEPDSND